jgi:phospholipase C
MKTKGVRHGKLVLAAGFLAAALLVAAGPAGATVARSAGADAPPVLGNGLIQHVVIVYQENHSFDNVLGALCVADHRCDGATTGKMPGGVVIPLRQATDLVPGVGHSVAIQTTAIDGGRMDGFALISGCKAAKYSCYAQYDPTQIPFVAALARAFVISDRTFEDGDVPSWGSHLGLVAGQFDGFVGDNPTTGGGTPGAGWGCDSGKDAPWKPWWGGSPLAEPACIPNRDGSGAYRQTPVRWIPTLMDRLDAAGLSWEIDAPSKGQSGYIWSTCPTFADCIYSQQITHVKQSAQVIANAQAGRLPSFSLVIPTSANSQHNSDSMLAGDNWINSVVSALMNGPEWSSTAVFVTWDDCGCFYDHVAPPSGLGIRVPMIIASPYARAGFTDSTVAQFASMLAFTEHVFGLQPLAVSDSRAYDYAGSFDFARRNDARVRLAPSPVAPAELRWLRAHPSDPNDPT